MTAGQGENRTRRTWLSLSPPQSLRCQIEPPEKRTSFSLPLIRDRMRISRTRRLLIQRIETDEVGKVFMAKGSTHLAIESFAGGILLTASVVAMKGGQLPDGVGWHHLAALAVGYLFSMLLLSPDLDLKRSSHSRRWGVLRFIWWPYHWIFRHRGMSHNFLVGTASRLVYLTLVILVMAMLFSHLWTTYGPGGFQGSVPQSGAGLLAHHLDRKSVV